MDADALAELVAEGEVAVLSGAGLSTAPGSRTTEAPPGPAAGPLR